MFNNNSIEIEEKNNNNLKMEYKMPKEQNLTNVEIVENFLKDNPEQEFSVQELTENLPQVPANQIQQICVKLVERGVAIREQKRKTGDRMKKFYYRSNPEEAPLDVQEKGTNWRRKAKAIVTLTDKSMDEVLDEALTQYFKPILNNME